MEEEGISSNSRGHNEVGQYICRAKEKELIYNDIKLLLNEYVYEPAEDSYILAKTVESMFNSQTVKSTTFVEIGTGSGYVSIYLISNIARKPQIYGILTDLSPCAVSSSWKSVKMNGFDTYIDVIQCYSAECLRGSITTLVFFNPPYLPTEEFDPLGISWSGGAEGIEVWEKFFINAIHICLKGLCVVVFILSSLQNVLKLLEVSLNTCRDAEIYTCSDFFYESICSVVLRC